MSLSNPTAPGQASDSGFSPPDPDGSYHPAAATDPLLQNGSFIDAIGLPTTNPNGDYPQPAPQSSSSMNGAEPATPPKSRRKVPVTMASQPADSASWLPPGWLVEDRVRSSGATAGTVDRYYFDPVTGRRFRSKKEVLYYLETGTLKKRKKGAENSEADVDSPEISKSDKNKKAGKNAKGPKITFDYVNVPDRIEWVLTDANEDCWTPFIGSERVPEYIKQNWEFEMLNPHHR